MKNIMLIFLLLVMINISKSKDLELMNTDYNNYISTVIISPGNLFKACLYNNDYIIIRDLPSNNIYDVCKLFKYSGNKLSIRFLNDSIILVNNFTDSLKKFIYKYNTHNKKVTDTITILDRSMTVDDTRFYFSKNSKSLYVLRTFAYIDKYDMETGEFVGEIVNPTPWDHIWQFAVSDDEQSFAYSFNESIQILDKNGQLIHQFNNSNHFNYPIYLPGSGNMLVTYFPSFSSMDFQPFKDTTIRITINGQYKQIYIDTCVYVYDKNKIIKYNTENYKLDTIIVANASYVNNLYYDNQDLKCFAYDSGCVYIYNVTQKSIENKYIYPSGLYGLMGILSNDALYF